MLKKIAMLKPRTMAKIAVFLNGQEKTVTVTSGELPEAAEENGPAQSEQKEQAALGLVLSPASAVAGSGGPGVVVTGIDPNGRAAESGIETGDIILAVERQPVNQPADVKKMINKARAQSKHAILMRIKRGDATSFVAVPIDRS